MLCNRSEGTPAGHFVDHDVHVDPQVPVPQHRLTPLRDSWMKLYQPVTEHLLLDMRMNLKTKKVCERVKQSIRFSNQGCSERC